MEFPPVKKRIAVIDGHPMVREGIVQVLNRHEDLVVCSEGDSVTSAWNAVTSERPDLLLLELQLGSGDTLELIKTLKSERSGLQILVFSLLDENTFAVRAIRAGARGYVMKQEPTQEVLLAIRTVLRGGIYISRQMAVKVFHESNPPAETAPVRVEAALQKLSDRELHVFRLIGSEMSNRQIADNLHLSVKTIESHRENIKNKLDLHCASALTQAATRWVRRAV
jgi:DNA-binding NarL/FixJ family response regulator